MASRGAIPDREVKRLYAVSGNLCAFTGCEQRLCEPGDSGEPGVVTGEMAHIVAASRQGPRGRGVLTDDERNSAENLILLCERHHKIVDRRPRTYTVDVLTEMKRRHEAPFLAAPSEATAAPVVSETLLSSLLVVSELPQQIRSAPYVAASPKEVAATVRWDADEGPVAFITRERRLFAFHDLRSASGPFARSVDRGAVESLTARDLCSTSDGQRWYVELLNRTLSWHLRSLGMRFDQGHNRYYFTLREDGSSPRMDYRSKTGRAMSRDVVREAMRRDGTSRGFWWHEAVALRFLPLRGRGCVLSVRPEYHLTNDGREPLDGPLVGRRVTRRKSRIYNGQYIDGIQFWREVITAGRPRRVLRVGGQRLVIENELLGCDITWPGVPNDVLALAAGPVPDDLLSLLDAEDFASDLDDDFDDDWDDDEG
ncbi:HNH endonuclease [Micromonospora provocatoris]|uniref:HNH endonuclease n=1 Tax=Micromonospora tulbaghiae TaxID=479978 RepID=UPI0015EFAB8E|nr:HNH endonuclease [Micromonospora provocatoris]